MWSDRLLLSIFERFPANDPIFKDPARRAEELEYPDEVASPFSAWFGLTPTQLFAGKDVLDLGSGFGGRTVRFAEYGVRSITGLEVSEEHVFYSRLMSEKKGVQSKVCFTIGRGEQLPFPDSRFDLITMYDVMEHVSSPRTVLHESHRVLRPGGLLATVFPPYYALHSGSHLHGYASSFPGLNLIFTTRALRSAALIFLNQRHVNYEGYLHNVEPSKLWNLNGLTVSGFRRLVRKSPFQIQSFRYMAYHDRRMTEKTGRELMLLKPAFWFFEFGARLPVAREVFCERVCALLRK